MALADNALISVDYLRQYVEADEDDSAIPPELLITYINAASYMIERFCGRKFITPSAAVDEIFDGNGVHEYYVTNCPITETPSVYYWSLTTFVSTTYTFTYDGDTGRVYFTDGSIFDEGVDNWKVSYKYGWAVSGLPEDLRLACALLAIHLRFRSQKMGITSESFGDGSTTYDMQAIPLVVQSILQKYRKLSYG